MRFVKAILILFLALMPVAGWALEKAGAPAPVEVEKGLPENAAILFSVGPLAITNSMIITIIVTVLIVIFAQLVSRNVTDVPAGLGNFAEWVVESLYNFLEGVLGKELVKKTFWFFASLFLFILATNWFGLVPGIGTVGWGHVVSTGGHEHFVIEKPLLRGGNADLNMTSALAMLFFFMWFVWALQANGPIGFLKHIFAPKGDSKGFMKLILIPIFFAVGLIEVISIIFRPVALSFRLYGNVFAGENILDAVMNVFPALAPIAPLPFYFLELLVGFVQALVFTLLTCVFTRLICEHHDEGHAHHDHEEGHGEPEAAKSGH